MADQVQWRGGSRQNSDQFTGAPREVTVDTSDWILRVHDGVTPGGHKMMKVNDCLKVETADKCNPNSPTCLVTVNGQLVAEGDAEFKREVLFDDDITVEGTANLNNVNVTGCILNNEPGKSVQVCDNLHVHGNVNVDKNLHAEHIFVEDGLHGVDDSMIDLLVPEAAAGCDGPGCCIEGAPEMHTVQDKLNWLQKALYQLESCHCNLMDASEIADGLLQKEIDRIEQLIKALELQIHQLQNEVAQNTLDIALLKKEIERLDNNIDAVNYCCTSTSKQICLDENATGLFLTEDGCLTDVPQTPAP